MPADIEIALIVLASVAPVLALLRWIYKSDYHPEPGLHLLTSFGLGVLTVLPIRAINQFTLPFRPEMASPILSALYVATLVAAAPEESCKFLVMMFYAVRRSSFDEPMDGLVHGAIISLGFALQENLFHTLDGGLAVAAARAVTAVPAHACFGIIMGYHAGLWRLGLRGVSSLILGWVAAVALHAAFDFPLICLRNLQRVQTRPFMDPFVRYGFSTLFVLFLAFLGWWTHRLVGSLRHAQIRGAESGSVSR